MKAITKIILLLLVTIFLSFTSFAQLTSKNGTHIMPEAGDFSIGFDAKGIVTLFGNAMYAAGGGAGFTTNNPMTVIGKYYLKEKLAIRTKIRIGIDSEVNKHKVRINGYSKDTDLTEDAHKISKSDIEIGGGIEFSKGKGRLVGLYGGEIGIVMGSMKQTYTYGNAIDDTYMNPESWDFDSSKVSTSGIRTTSSDAGSTFGMIVRGFVGVEYFFLPKMSLGIEYGWGLNMTSTNEGETTVESWDATAGVLQTLTTPVSGSSKTTIDNDVSSGAVSLNFYF